MKRRSQDTVTKTSMWRGMPSEAAVLAGWRRYAAFCAVSVTGTRANRIIHEANEVERKGTTIVRHPTRGVE